MTLGDPDIRAIDLNADLGEGYGPWTMGDDAAMLDIVTSANVACGGHASDPETMFKTMVLARDRGIIVGAHPSYPDREGFGRRRLPYTPAEIERFVAAQVGALAAIGALAGYPVSYVKPHGALANVAAADRPTAEAIVRAVTAIDGRLAILAISGTELERVARERKVECYSEIFADRGYQADGQLTPRGESGALIRDAAAASARLLAYLETGLMPTVSGGEIALRGDSICIHGDNDHAVAMARRLRQDLEQQGFRVRSFMTRGH